MTDHDQLDEPSAELPAAGVPEAQSVLDRIRGDRDVAISDHPTEDFKFPSGDGSGLVWVRVRPLTPKETKKLRDKAAKSKNPDRAWLSILDTIAAATETVCVQDSQEKIQPLHEMLGEDEPYLFGAELARQFAGPAHPDLEGTTTARECISRLAHVNRVGRLPVEALYAEIMGWMAEGVAEADEETLGE